MNWFCFCEGYFVFPEVSFLGFAGFIVGVCMGKRKKYKKQAEKEEAIESGSSNKIVISVVVVILAVVVGLSLKGGSRDSTLRSDFPDFVYTTDNSVRAYTIADEMPEVLEKIPCYCSCVRVGHDSLKDCFHSSGGGYSQHGAYCSTCIYEALDVKKWKDQGLDIKEIRSRIDEKYGGGKFAEGTDTPPV